MNIPKNIKIKSSLKIKNQKNITKKICQKKIHNYKTIIQDTILYVQKYKILDIIDAGELNLCVSNLEKIFNDCYFLEEALNTKKKNKNYEQIIDKLQTINDELSVNFKSYGTKNIEDLLNVVFGNNYVNTFLTSENKDLYNVIKKYLHPTNFKLIDWKKRSGIKKPIIKNKIVEDFALADSAKTLDCFDLARTTNKFQSKVYGIKICFQNSEKKKILIISCIADDMLMNCLESKFIKEKIISLKQNKPKDDTFLTEDFNRFIGSLTLKELLIYNEKELHHKYAGYLSQSNLIKKKTISQVIKEFISDDLYQQRKTLILLLIKNKDPEFQYLAYLLYDLLSAENGNSYDTLDQTILFDSLPWPIKKYFRDAMKTTIKYTKNLSNFDINKIPIEQQICLMKATDKVKEKAMLKLKEVKAKSEDSGSKARQYLDGLLRIPFGIFKSEKILSLMKDINIEFKNLVETLKKKDKTIKIKEKQNYSYIEIKNHIKYLRDDYCCKSKITYIKHLEKYLTTGKKDTLVYNVSQLNNISKKLNLKKSKIKHSGKKNSDIKKEISLFLNKVFNNDAILQNLIKKYKNKIEYNSICVKSETQSLENKWDDINSSFKSIRTYLDDSIYGHKKAKRQIERVIGQWITGKQSGYCFGFEGPPGVGKTSLARKGLANCLKDHDGSSRPFSFIALGGSSNASTLSGHNYTYVGSTWGRVIDILMESKCMNPIIFIDELDKVSRTENGKEIIGILTHLIDPTQNESFQDKYFSGIDIDMSRVLFIFSYNDPSIIDRILLDRIHRVKFDNLTLEDKLEICYNYILPEIFKKMGIENVIEFSKKTLMFIIENYTQEAGVRKLKELLFEIISEINLEILNNEKDYELPIKITEKDVERKYFKEKYKKNLKKIHKSSQVGIMNGLWANSMGMGGIIPIETFFFPSTTFLDLKLTGLQGDVMKESMNVAKTLAWKLTSNDRKKQLLEEFEKHKLQGIHIHCPEGSVPKDGPSAGTAITVAIFSLLNEKKINHTLAITGEINLQGKVTAIGGLELKILGGIKAGITHFLFPKQNETQYNLFLEKFKNKNVIPKETKFTSVEEITDVLDIVYV